MTKCEIKKFAPVIIPTLCRYEHLKKCLESLSKCTWAEKTDVYVGLDFPTEKKHQIGYQKIKKYLKSQKFAFRTLNVIERPHNYGIGPNGNFEMLQREILKIYDAYIGSEDDNVFSPDFLEFMNLGLEKFKDDKSVLAINGYRHYYPFKSADNTFFKQNVCFSAWGYGIWRDRFESLSKTDFFRKIFSLQNFFRIKKIMGANRAFDFAKFCFNPPLTFHDSPLSIYAFLNNMDFVMPSKISLVRNIGWDASGEHCIANKDLCDKHLNQEISETENFEFVGTGYEYYEENRKIFKDYSYAKISELTFWKRFLKFIVKYLIFKIKN